jgi:thymidylate synthase (FAD)
LIVPKQVPIEIFNFAKTQVQESEVYRWLEHVGVPDYVLPENVTNPALVIALAAKRCYMSFEPGLNPNVTKVRSDMVQYFDNILKSGHGSVLEHSTYSFAIEGVSRVFTAEMNRHRAGWAISEGSLRFIRFDKDIPYWLPTSLQPNHEDDTELAMKKAASVEVFERAFRHQEECYKQLLDIWDMDEGSKNFDYKKKVTSCMRRIVGMGVATGGVWTGNFRALRHVLASRTSPHAEEEMIHVFSRIAKYMVDHEPMVFGDGTFDGETWVPRDWKV